jgi:hypothetical protein
VSPILFAFVGQNMENVLYAFESSPLQQEDEDDCADEKATALAAKESKEESMMDVDGTPKPSTVDFTYPKYLTSRRLLNFEVSHFAMGKESSKAFLLMSL